MRNWSIMTTEDSIDLDTVNLSLMNYESQNLLSSLLNTKKIFPSDAPEKFPRDWRGLATLLNISSEIACSINECQDKTAKVLEIWLRKGDGTATVGNLLSFLKKIDRYDICDDLLELSSKGRLISKQSDQAIVQKNQAASLGNNGLITFYDVQCGSPQLYDAYVLYAFEDKEFVDELLGRMRARGYTLCTEYDLLPGYNTQYGPISKLISERCNRIILVYSPDFLNGVENNFYMDYAQAVAIESRQLKILPLMYRKCELPLQHRHYYGLYYTPPGQKAAYDFWEKLAQSLEYSRIANRRSPSSPMKITELSFNNEVLNSASTALLALPEIPTRSVSMNGLSLVTSSTNLNDTISLEDISKKKEKSKKNSVKKFFSSKLSSLRGKKEKKAVLVQN